MPTTFRDPTSGLGATWSWWWKILGRWWRWWSGIPTFNQGAKVEVGGGIMLVAETHLQIELTGQVGDNGLTNTGGGGGGSSPNAPKRGGSGGSGVVLIAYDT